MPIWGYDHIVPSLSETRQYVDSSYATETCIYCHERLLESLNRYSDHDYPPIVVCTKATCNPTTTHLNELIKVCPACGWWIARQTLHRIERHIDVTHGAVGSLLEFDATSPEAPLQELRAFLRARYESRFVVDPWRFEEVVASVYRDFGFSVRVTARSNDGGIDVILEGADSPMIGVQVKRYKNAIEVEKVHALAGALVRRGITTGVFVTTSRFQPGAERAAAELAARGTSIQLVDGKKFFEALGIAQRLSISDLRTVMPRRLHHIAEQDFGWR